MNFLKKFAEPMEIHGLADVRCQAYRMDGGRGKEKPDMRKCLGFGTCNVCDYLLISADAVVLIEDKRLAAWMQNIKKEIGGQEAYALCKLTRRLAQLKLCLKLYGSLLMLCELAKRDKSFAKMWQKKSSHFWFVLTDSDEKNAKALDYFCKNLTTQLTGELKPFVNKVNIFSVKNLPTEIKRLGDLPKP